MKKQKPVSLLDYLTIIVNWRKFIVRNVLLITVFAVIVSLLLPKKYMATATMLPPSSDQSLMFGLMSSGLPSGLGNIPGISSILPGLATPSDLYAAILKSGRIKGKIIKKYNLQNVFKTKKMYQTYEMLNEITQIEVSLEGLISVTITYKDRELVAEIANAYVEELDEFNTETAMTTGKKYRIFIEQRLNETIDSLSKAEETLKTFQETHRTVALDVEIGGAISAAANLKREIIMREIKKDVLATSTQQTNPYFESLNREIRELKKQLSKIEFGSKKQNKNEFGVGYSVPFSELPEVSLKYARLLRDLKVQEVIFELLSQQYEQAKIMELKDTPTVQILDRATPPERKAYPKRALIIMLVFFVSIIANIMVAFFIEFFNEEKKIDNSSINRLLYLVSLVKNDLTNIMQKFRRK